MEKYDPSVTTHILIDENFVKLGSLLQLLKLSDLSQIPGHIPILKWSWATYDNTKLHYRHHAAFISRRNSVDAIDYDPSINPITIPHKQSSSKGKQRASSKSRSNDSSEGESGDIL